MSDLKASAKKLGLVVTAGDRGEGYGTRRLGFGLPLKCRKWLEVSPEGLKRRAGKLVLFGWTLRGEPGTKHTDPHNELCFFPQEKTNNASLAAWEAARRSLCADPLALPNLPGSPADVQQVCVPLSRYVYGARVIAARTTTTSTSVPATARVCHCACHCHWVRVARACVAATRRVCVTVRMCHGDFSESGSHVCVRGFVIVCVRSKLRVRKSQGPRQSCVRVPRSGKSNRMQFCKTIG